MTSDPDTLAACLEVERPRLIMLAARVLGSRADAEEVVQDAWLRLETADANGIANLKAWLSTVVARAAIDRLRQRRSHAEIPLYEQTAQVIEIADTRLDPEAEAIHEDAVGGALLVVLDRLRPVERLAFVLHDLLGLSFDEVAPVVGRSVTAVRQLASRARRRVKIPRKNLTAGMMARAEIVTAFAKASREGKMEDLLRLLDPDVKLVVYPDTSPADVPYIVQGITTVAARARVGAGSALAVLMLVGATPGLVVVANGEVKRVLSFLIEEDRIVKIEVVAEQSRLARMDLKLFDFS